MAEHALVSLFFAFWGAHEPSFPSATVSFLELPDSFLILFLFIAKSHPNGKKNWPPLFFFHCSCMEYGEKHVNLQSKKPILTNNSMKTLVITIISALGILTAKASTTSALLERLDSVLTASTAIEANKLKRIELLKSLSHTDNAPLFRLEKFKELTDEYYVYKFDSAMVYVDKGLALSEEVGNVYYTSYFTIKKAKLLAIGGLYSEATSLMDSLSTDSLNQETRFQYHAAYSIIYAYWADYCNDQIYRPRYRHIADHHLREAIRMIDPKMDEYHYFMGEYYVYVGNDSEKSRDHYLQTIEHLDEHSRVYAMASYAIANYYSAQGDSRQYEEYLIKACISDILCCTKENLALQDLALYLLKQGNENAERAQRYIHAALSDATFYNNRLRILEISQKLPIIVTTYQQTVTQQNQILRIALGCCLFLGVGMMVLLYFVFRQNKLLSKRRHELYQSNSQLTEANSQLNQANALLLDTNKRREGLAKLYIDLCAKYIDKLEQFQVMVQRKIKAKQVNELLSYTSSSRVSKEDAATFMNRFDKAFLDLYPSFIQEFNTLLKDEEQLVIQRPGSLTTELRIFALIRLGVKESSEIASLLYYTPRTIYNYRSAFKNKAKDRNAFEEQVSQICTVITNS